MVHCLRENAALLSLILWPSHPSGSRALPWAVPASLFWQLGMCVLPWACPQSVIPSQCPFLGWRRRRIKPSMVGFLPDHGGAAQHFHTWGLLVSVCLEIAGLHWNSCLLVKVWSPGNEQWASSAPGEVTGRDKPTLLQESLLRARCTSWY